MYYKQKEEMAGAASLTPLFGERVTKRVLAFRH